MASKVDLVFSGSSLLLSLRCSAGVESWLEYFVGLFVVNKGVHFVVVTCVVHNSSHPSLVLSTDVIQLTLTLRADCQNVK